MPCLSDLGVWSSLVGKRRPLKKRRIEFRGVKFSIGDVKDREGLKMAYSGLVVIDELYSLRRMYANTCKFIIPKATGPIQLQCFLGGVEAGHLIRFSLYRIR
jgi:hypothetical protein